MSPFLRNNKRTVFFFFFSVFSPAAEYDKHPNEVVKNEELTYNGSSTAGGSSTATFVTLVLVLVQWAASRR